MKLNSILIALSLTAVVVLAAGCTSSSNSNTGTPTQNPSISGVVSAKPSASMQGLTEAQKTGAVNIAKDDTRVKEILSKSGYIVTGVTTGENAVTATVYIEGGNTVRSDGSIWTPDIYQVAVDLSGKKVTDIRHIEPKSLPTPTPKT